MQLNGRFSHFLGLRVVNQFSKIFEFDQSGVEVTDEDVRGKFTPVSGEVECDGG